MRGEALIRPILIDLPDAIEGERVLLRPPCAGDGPAIHEAVAESTSHIYPWLPWAGSHQTLEDSEEFARRAHAQWITREDLPIAIFERDTRRYLGGSGLHRINWEVPSFEIGYWIRKSEEGKGYITESVRLLLHLSFELLHAERVFIRCATTNTRSRAVPERLKFPVEGTHRNEVRLADGSLADMVSYCLTADDWRIRGRM